MDGVIEALQAAIAVAMATTFDDNIYLTGFFSENDRSFRPIHVVVGELLGFTALMATSWIASRLLAETIPLSSIGWLGLMPLLIGLFNLIQLFQPVQPRELVAMTVKGSPEDGYASKRLKLRTVLRQHHTYKVSAVTLSNGGNNLSIYIPLLATSSLPAALLTVAICYLAVISWLTISFRLTRLPLVAIHLSRHARRLFPFVLMWLGWRILHDSGAWTGLESKL
ncbi:MAG: cadmium resistance transporter [Cyanobacteriota bacterium]